tara:strand:+ start:376 stop:630 length:255 start_codon:yes stop_codon:yes gene_type:complete
MSTSKGNTAGPKLASQALSTLREAGVRHCARNTDNGELKGVGVERESNLHARIRAIQFVIHTGEVYQPIIEQYKAADPGEGVAA